MQKKYSAVVVFSGGQDSTTVLAMAINRWRAKNVLTLAFDYDQRHRVELASAKTIAAKLGVDYIPAYMPAMKLMASSALINGGDVNAEHSYLVDRPASFVPARNAMFLTAAYGVAMEAGAEHIYTGVSQADYSGYPDCRKPFVQALNTALNIGYENDIIIHAPLMHKTKAQTFALAEENGILRTVLELSHTCYTGNHTDKHEWGYGCAECPACKLRAAGYAEYRANRK